MAKSLSKRLKTFFHETGRHLARAVRREEPAGEALAEIWAQTRRLGRGARGRHRSKGRQEAVNFAKRGTQAYNRREYAQAEALFRKAIEDDPHYARAHTYLGNALYKQTRVLEAVQQWQIAIRVEPDSEAAQEAQEKIFRLQQHRTQHLNEVIDEMQR